MIFDFDKDLSDYNLERHRRDRELQNGATTEVERHRRDRHRLKPGEIKTHVQDRDGRSILMQRHLRLLKRTSQRRVNFRREARDDGSGFADKYRGGEKLETSETLLCQGALKSV